MRSSVRMDKKVNGVLPPLFEGANLKNSQEEELTPKPLVFFVIKPFCLINGIKNTSIKLKCSPMNQ